MTNKWTEEEIKIIKENYHKGISFVQTLINRSKGSIAKKGERLKLKVDKNEISIYKIDILSNIISESFSFSEIFRKLNKSFESINSGALPTDIKEYNYSNDGIVAFISTVAKMSRSDARRLLQQGGVTVSKDGVNLTKIDMSYEPENGDILKIGKRNYAKIVK